MSVQGPSPVQPTPTPDDKPGLGSKEDPGQRPFSLSPEPSQKAGGPAAAGQKPSPMELLGQPKWSQGEMQTKIDVLNNKLETVKTRLQGPEGQTLTKEHQEALKILTDKMTPEMQTIANKSHGEFKMPSYAKGEGVMGFITDWVSSSQGTMQGALTFLQSKPNISSTDMLALQVSMQRAAQMVEITSSVIGSTVSGIKSLMSTQLG